MKKRVVVLLVLLFLLIEVNSDLSSGIYSFNTTVHILYVGGTGPGNYTSIQHAIDNASNGDTIFVFSGVYNESITSGKSLSLMGENRESTIIHGIDTSDLATCFLSGNRSRISGFTIKEGEGKCRTGIYLWHSSHNTISDCNFSMYSSGHPGVIAMEIQHDSSYNTIKNCIIFSKFKGIEIGGQSDGNKVINCDFTIPLVADDGISGDESISIWDGCYDTVIENCSINGGDGIMVWGSGTMVSNCSISHTIGNRGFDLAYCSNTTLRNNALVNASFHFRVNEQAQLYHDIDSSNTINGKPMYYLVDENDFRVNDSWDPGFLGLAFCHKVTIDGINVQGIVIGGSSKIKIRDCRVHHSDGIAAFYSDYIDVSNCSVSSSDMGVDLDFFCSNSSISNCSFTGGISGVGVDLYCDNVTIVDCVAKDCQVSGFGIGGKNNVVDNVTASNIKYWGIRIGGSNNMISHCFVANNSIGIGVDGENCKFKCNEIHNNMHGMFCLYGSNNGIYHNNFIDNTFNANTSFPNRWKGNYWDDWIGLHIETLHFLPYHVTTTHSQNFVRTFLSSFDWYPAQEPYDIGGGT